MLKNPACKYKPVLGPHLPDRQWPNAQISRAPAWLSTDLRDGNQALFEPMDAARKLQLFQTLLKVGFKEIEISFPSASKIEFDFTRSLIERHLIPDDVTVMVMTPARAELIDRTFESLRGVRNAIISLYNATAPVWRRDVFGLSQEQVKSMAVAHALLVRAHFEKNPQTEWTLQYSPEAFSATEMPFALEVCNAVIEAMAPTPSRPMIINLPATVEVSMPNVFADQVEWMHRHLKCRDSVILSVHLHNDRGTAVAAAEMALLAGAQRIEGCLFGQGERSGNVDLVTLALNLYSQGISPGLDFSNIDETQRLVEHCSRLPISPRHPYAGEMVYTAFSGSHQDAIRKGMALRNATEQTTWEVPYLPIDPKDLGRTYASLIRVNSQSGKGGIAYLMETEHGLHLPRRMLIDFSAVVKRHADEHGSEISASTLLALWLGHYQPERALQLVSHHFECTDHTSGSLSLSLRDPGQHAHSRSLLLQSPGPTLLNAASSALCRGLGWPLEILGHTTQTLKQAHGGGEAETLVMVEAGWHQRPGARWGVGVHVDPDQAALMALLHAAAAWAESEQLIGHLSWEPRPLQPAANGQAPGRAAAARRASGHACVVVPLQAGQSPDN
jgi:2-isopropylmalate synthase